MREYLAVSAADSHQSERLRQFITWICAIVVAFVLIYGAAFVVFRTLPAIATTIALSSYVGVLLLARRQLRSGQAPLAVVTVCGGLLIADLLIVWIQPQLSPALAVIPLVAVGVMLPFAKGRVLLTMMAVCWLATIAVGLIGEFGSRTVAFPIWFDLTTRVAALGAAAALVLLLLWQFSSRLNETLDSMAHALRSLHDAQEVERRSQDTFAALLDATPDLLLRISADGTFLDFKPQADAPPSAVASEYVGHKVTDVFSPEVARDFMRHIEQALETRSMQVWEYRHATEGDLQEREARVVVSGEAEALVIVRDITERKRAEEQRLAFERNMLETQRRESLGVLAGGVAHDFNNLLTTILGNAGLALMDLPLGSPLRGSIKQIESAAERAADLTRQMLAYAGKGRFLIQRVDLNSMIQENLRLLGASIGAGIALRYSLAPDLPPIEGDIAQIRQVLMNLIINAAEAIGDQDGTIVLRTGLYEGDRTQLDALGITGACVALEVADTGHGMDEATLTRIFDPFFTTKFTGRGLGLAAVQGIVRSHSGALRVASRPGHGSTITILLPAAPALIESKPEPTDIHLADPPAARGTVLVIDDEAGVRIFAARVLEQLGYQVLRAADGRGGVDLFREHAGTIAWVLLDLTMPHLHGSQVFAELQRIRLGVRVVLMSGYAADEAARRFGAATIGFLQKPFTPEALRDIALKALGTPPTTPDPTPLAGRGDV
jgi:PAS domain S-box-containing protein